VRKQRSSRTRGSKGTKTRLQSRSLAKIHELGSTPILKFGIFGFQITFTPGFLFGWTCPAASGSVIRPRGQAATKTCRVFTHRTFAVVRSRKFGEIPSSPFGLVRATTSCFFPCDFPFPGTFGRCSRRVSTLLGRDVAAPGSPVLGSFAAPSPRVLRVSFLIISRSCRAERALRERKMPGSEISRSFSAVSPFLRVFWRCCAVPRLHRRRSLRHPRPRSGPSPRLSLAPLLNLSPPGSEFAGSRRGNAARGRLNRSRRSAALLPGSLRLGQCLRHRP
jgi:hypothetical protein